MKCRTYSSLGYHLFELLVKLIYNLLLPLNDSVSFDALVLATVDYVILLVDDSLQLVKTLSKVSYACLSRYRAQRVISYLILYQGYLSFLQCEIKWVVKVNM